MSKPWIHAKASARRYGGKAEDYLAIHDFMDSTKASMPDVRHRAILHTAFGCFLVEKVFGTVLKNSAGMEYSPRDIAEEHCLEDMGKIPTMQDFLGLMEIKPWMGKPQIKRTIIPMMD